MSSSPSPRTSFKYVYIPCDPDCALEELTMAIPEGKEMEILLDTLKDHFRSVSGTVGSGAEQKAIFKKQLEEQSGKMIDDSLMDIAARMQMVQPVALLPGGKATDWEHINCYVDDRGISKGLRRNDRASGLAAECGAPTDIVGDAFLARIIDDDDRFERHDFTLAEVSSSAPWVKRAHHLHLSKKQNIGQVQEQLRAMGGGVNGAADKLGLQDNLPEPGPPPGAVEHGVVHPYEWAQEGEDVVVTVQVPAETTKGDVKCNFKVMNMHLEVASMPEGERVVVNGALELCFEVVPSECSWSILKNKDGSKRLEVTLTKGKEMRWLCFTRMQSAPETTQPL
mmetsp:Transcript_11186/g.27289  ORF Transcript_11186/g.27289 Transcript_11186/m.27289 type:complete len:338 (-) Transcript_11186:390-1403(-)